MQWKYIQETHLSLTFCFFIPPLQVQIGSFHFGEDHDNKIPWKHTQEMHVFLKFDFLITPYLQNST